ncbi:type II toxin-antitoxin system PemK/MazF family toxin [Peteryoungia desertarenae]|uniref:Type II toxin-antitoxin system PemK/MazF family toxin n=1 Tax=Peteryoungia desertarenae TaxID=1813451 RepID=A0ABX6QRW0_9HYPH|nr:type II toxin-antitoxin system PemK/MazF family toxin [Peteryoungia desertarenae]QLF71361.1 type II toxin-antitoxin system PemK/MazF family toxin [Peteryoungia desertarenae]
MVTVAISGDFGKPRPALIIQSDSFQDTGTVTVLLMTSTVIEASLLRISVSPTPLNGLTLPSQIMVDKIMSIRRDKVGRLIGQLDEATMLQVTRSLAVFMGIG